MWFGNLWFDLNRFLPIDMTNIKAFGYGYQKLFFPSGDYDYTRLMDDNNFKRYEYGIKKLAPTVYDLISPLFGNDMQPFYKRIGFLLTGLNFSDDSAKQMLTSFYSNDYDKMLQSSDYQWNQFNQWRTLKKMNPLTKENVASLKAFNTLIFGSSTENKWYAYINGLTDYLTMQYADPKTGVYKDMDPFKEIRKGLKGLVTDMMVGLAWNNGETLADKANTLATHSVDKDGNLVPLKKGQKSVLENMKALWTMDDFLERLNFYAQNYKAIKSFQTANTKYRKYNVEWQAPRWTTDEIGTAKDNATVAAFKYYFQEEINNPTWQKLEQSNPEEYLARKTEAILNGTLTKPVENDVVDDLGSHHALTNIYEQYMKFGKGIILTDLEKAKARVNTLERLRSIAIKQATDPANAQTASYYRSNYNKLTSQIEWEKLLLEKNNPTMYELDKIMDVNDKIKYEWAKTWPEAMEIYKQAVVKKYAKTQTNYLYAKKKFLKNNILSNKNATFKFTQENGISPQQLDTIYNMELQSLGQ